MALAQTKTRNLTAFETVPDLAKRLFRQLSDNDRDLVLAEWMKLEEAGKPVTA